MSTQVPPKASKRTKKSSKWIIVSNWERFQHYKDRGDDHPPWIKLYTKLLHDQEFLRLPYGTRAVLFHLWLEYASTRRQLLLDTRLLSRQFNMRVTIRQLEALNHAGYITFSSRPGIETVKSKSSPRALAREELLRSSQEGASAGASNGAAPAPEEEDPSFLTFDEYQALVAAGKLPTDPILTDE